MKQLKHSILALRVWRDTRGQDLVEYALAAGLVAVALNVTGANGQTVTRATVEVLWRRDVVSNGEAAPADLADVLTCVPL